MVGESYRNNKGQPAEPVVKVIAQLKGFEALTLGEWRQHKQQAAQPKKPTGGAGRGKKCTLDAEAAAGLVRRLEEAASQEELRRMLAELTSTLNADGWKSVESRLLGKASKTGKVSRERIEAHLSNELLLRDRVQSVKRIYG